MDVIRTFFKNAVSLFMPVSKTPPFEGHSFVEGALLPVLPEKHSFSRGELTILEGGKPDCHATFIVSDAEGKEAGYIDVSFDERFYPQFVKEVREQGIPCDKQLWVATDPYCAAVVKFPLDYNG